MSRAVLRFMPGERSPLSPAGPPSGMRSARSVRRRGLKSHDHQLNWWHDIDPIRVIYQPRLKTHEDLPIAFHSQAAAKAALFLASEILFPRKRIIVFFH